MKKPIPLTALALAMTLGSTTFAGRVPSPGIDVKIVRAHSRVSYSVLFQGGETARVTIRGDGDTDVDVYIYDDLGNLVTRGIGLTDRETVTWFPNRTRRYRIVVRNLGSVWNRVRLTTN